jgi:hypothetical protein
VRALITTVARRIVIIVIFFFIVAIVVIVRLVVSATMAVYAHVRVMMRALLKEQATVVICIIECVDGIAGATSGAHGHAECDDDGFGRHSGQPRECACSDAPVRRRGLGGACGEQSRAVDDRGSRECGSDWSEERFRGAPKSVACPAPEKLSYRSPHTSSCARSQRDRRREFRTQSAHTVLRNGNRTRVE